MLVYGPAIVGGAAPCVRFDDGNGVWALVGRGAAAVAYCPGRRALGPPIPTPRISHANEGAMNLP